MPPMVTIAPYPALMWWGPVPVRRFLDIPTDWSSIIRAAGGDSWTIRRLVGEMADRRSAIERGRGGVGWPSPGLPG
jgi:hypothetical protein